MIVPPMAAVARAREGQEPGLSAIGYLERTDPGLREAVRWGRDELDPEEAVVAEAISESYDAGNRFSAFTGIPTILGGPGHERQWHRGIDERSRRAAVDAIYIGTRARALDAIWEWGVTHVVVTHEERAAYGPRVAMQFTGWPVFFQTPSVQIFRTPYTPGSELPRLAEDPATGNPL